METFIPLQPADFYYYTGSIVKRQKYETVFKSIFMMTVIMIKKIKCSKLGWEYSLGVNFLRGNSPRE